MLITNRRRFGRRAAKAALAFCILRDSAAQGAGVDPECVSDLNSLMARIRHYVRSSSERNLAAVLGDDALLTPKTLDAQIAWVISRQQTWLDLA